MNIILAIGFILLGLQMSWFVLGVLDVIDMLDKRNNNVMALLTVSAIMTLIVGFLVSIASF